MKSPLPDPPIVLGGGYAGVAAAVALADAGLRPILLESRPYLGGRARSFAHRATGDTIDNGRHLMMGCYGETLALLERLGTRGLLVEQPRLHVPFHDRSGPSFTVSAASFLPAPLDVLAGLLTFPGITARERLALLRLGWNVRGRGPRDDETVDDYLRRLGQSDRVRRALWDPLTIATLNTAPAVASARLFAAVMRLAFLGGGSSSSFLFPRVGLSELIEPAVDAIAERGGAVRCGEMVRSVEPIDGGWEVVTRERSYTTATLLSALPWRGFSSLFGRHLPASLGTPAPHNPIVSLYLWYDAEIEEIPRFAALLGTTIEWVFNRRLIVGRGSPEGRTIVECVISAADGAMERSDDELVAKATEELGALFPTTRSIALRESLVIREKQATFAATPAVDRLRPAVGLLLPGLYLAGDWTATGLPGTIEGATRSGGLAAAMIRAATR